MCVRVRVRVCAFVRGCVCVCMHACMRVCEILLGRGSSQISVLILLQITTKYD